MKKLMKTIRDRSVKQGIQSEIQDCIEDLTEFYLSQGKAPGAAGKIHTDFERGFIRAEVVAFDDLNREGDRNKVKEKGLLRSEGKEYVMKDGDVVEFLFNV